MSELKNAFELAVLEVFSAAGRHKGLVPLLGMRQSMDPASKQKAAQRQKREGP